MRRVHAPANLQFNARFTDCRRGCGRTLVANPSSRCFFVGIDAELDVAPATELASGSEYPLVAGSRLDPDHGNPALAAIVTPTRITSQQNYQEFMIVLHSLSKPIQTALLTSTDMATKGIRFLRRQYGAVPGDQEFSSFTAM
eukprot:gene21886-28924_t